MAACHGCNKEKEEVKLEREDDAGCGTGFNFFMHLEAPGGF